MTTLEECAFPGCDKTFIISSSARRKREYCSNAHRQKAYRVRKKPDLKRSNKGVTFNGIEELIGILNELPIDQLQALQQQIEIALKSRQSDPEEPFLYFQKGSGAIHLAVDRNVTICGRDAEGMMETATTGDSRICSFCAKTRERGNWWKDWRNVFGDES